MKLARQPGEWVAREREGELETEKDGRRRKREGRRGRGQRRLEGRVGRGSISLSDRGENGKENGNCQTKTKIFVVVVVLAVVYGFVVCLFF